jgi:hydrogenase expression/formation protein HypE
MRIGKLTNEQLKSIVLSKLRIKRDVLLRSGVGEDCAALDFNGEACVMSTDPITGATKDLGRLAIDISCNDVASSGAHPEAALVTLLIPPNCTIEEIEKVIEELTREADEQDIDIIGGHTEVTDAVTRIIASTTVIGRIRSASLIRSSGAKPGDSIIMTGYAATEGTYIIASERRDSLKHILTESDEKTIEKLGTRLSVVKEGIAAGRLGAAAMHDVTEGGVYGAVFELCEASGAGCELYKEKIPMLDVTKKICAHFGLDPYKLIGSGSMLITSNRPDSMKSGLDKEGIDAAVIGRITDKGIYVIENGNRLPLDPPGADELFSV